MARKYHQGKFKPTNPKKYKGNPDEIFYRSGWEFKCMKWADANPSIVAWASEEIVIPYWSPCDQKMRRYFTDFFIEAMNSKGEIKKYLVEVKPFAQTQKPVAKKGKKKATLLEECITYETNMAKWAAAREFCKTQGWEFIVLTEHEIGV